MREMTVLMAWLFWMDDGGGMLCLSCLSGRRKQCKRIFDVMAWRLFWAY